MATSCHTEKTTSFEVVSYGSCSNRYSSVAWAHNVSYLTSTWVVLVNNGVDLRLSFAFKKICFIFIYAHVCDCVHTCTGVGAQSDQRRVLDPVELGL